jgi:hypothetical protein
MTQKSVRGGYCRVELKKRLRWSACWIGNVVGGREDGPDGGIFFEVLDLINQIPLALRLEIKDLRRGGITGVELKDRARRFVGLIPVVK